MRLNGLSCQLQEILYQHNLIVMLISRTIIIHFLVLEMTQSQMHQPPMRWKTVAVAYLYQVRSQRREIDHLLHALKEEMIQQDVISSK